MWIPFFCCFREKKCGINVEVWQKSGGNFTRTCYNSSVNYYIYSVLLFHCEVSGRRQYEQLLKYRQLVFNPRIIYIYACIPVLERVYVQVQATVLFIPYQCRSYSVMYKTILYTTHIHVIVVACILQLDIITHSLSALLRKVHNIAYY